MNTVKLLIVAVLLSSIPTLTLAGGAPTGSNTPKIEAQTLDPRARILRDYFDSYSSPLQYQAQNFIDAADTYNLDWKLVPAISGVESTFGKAAYGYNAWGWGIYGNQALGFKSWREGIYAVSSGLKQNYVDKGLTDPYKMNRAYAASPSWGWKVNFFMKDLENFASRYN